MVEPVFRVQIPSTLQCSCAGRTTPSTERSVTTAVLSLRSAGATAGSATRRSTPRSVRSRGARSSATRRSPGVASRSAGAMTRVAPGSARAAGRSSRAIAEASASTGASRAFARIATRSVAASSTMAAGSAAPLRSSAANVVAPPSTSDASSTARGASAPENAATPRTNPSRSVSGATRRRRTDCSAGSPRCSSENVWLSWVPRPAVASPRRISTACSARAERRPKTSKVSETSTTGTARRSGSVPPAGTVRRLVPGMSETYFAPSSERGRIVTPLSVGSPACWGSRARRMRANGGRSPAGRTACTSRTTPTRVPPTRTSLLAATRRAASGTSTVMS
jgi:hypothetical protein